MMDLKFGLAFVTLLGLAKLNGAYVVPFPNYRMMNFDNYPVYPHYYPHRPHIGNYAKTRTEVEGPSIPLIPANNPGFENVLKPRSQLNKPSVPLRFLNDDELARLPTLHFARLVGSTNLSLQEIFDKVQSLAVQLRQHFPPGATVSFGLTIDEFDNIQLYAYEGTDVECETATPCICTTPTATPSPTSTPSPTPTPSTTTTSSPTPTPQNRTSTPSTVSVITSSTISTATHTGSTPSRTTYTGTTPTSASTITVPTPRPGYVIVCAEILGYLKSNFTDYILQFGHDVRILP